MALMCTIAGSAGVWLLATNRHTIDRGERQFAGAVGRLRSLWSGVRPPTIRASLSGIAAAAVGGVAAWVLFGSLLASTVAAALSAGVPAGNAASRRKRRVQTARQAWPRMLAEIRVQIANRGRSIPAALFAAGTHAPLPMRAGFSSAARNWAFGTDFEASLRTLKAALRDPIADAVCETLLAAHQIGGVDLDARLRALAQAAQAEAAAREDARAKQAGARFARIFVLVVPAVMAFIGLSVGRGRAAYQMPNGQLLVALSLLAMAGCWLWAGRIMAIPQRRRVFRS